MPLFVAKQIKEQVVANGRAIASLWMVRHHLSLSGSVSQNLGGVEYLCHGCVHIVNLEMNTLLGTWVTLVVVI